MEFNYSYIKLGIPRIIDKFFEENYQCIMKVFDEKTDSKCILRVKYEESANIGDKTKYLLEITSNEKELLDNLMYLKLDYPYIVSFDDRNKIIFLENVRFNDIYLFHNTGDNPIYKLDLIL